jgi:hypothetical protein
MAEIDTSKIEAYIPLIDDRSEETISSQAQDLIRFLSNNQLNDFTDGNPLGVLVRALSFAQAEFLYRTNKLPLSLLLTFLASAGVTRTPATKAVASVTFTLSSPRNIPYQIPAGFEIVSISNNLRFFTKNVLTIPAGFINGVVDVEAEKTGAEYNLPAFSISRITQPLAFLASVINTSPASGGGDAEPIEDAINRGFREVRIRNLVSELDFEQAAVTVMGVGSAAKCIGLLGPDKITKKPGAIHLFCLSTEGVPAGIGLLNSVQSALQPNILLGTTLYVSAMEVSPVDIYITARIDGAIPAATIADNLEKSIKSYLSPRSFRPGETLHIEEVRHQLRFVEGIQFIDYILLNDLPNNIEPDNAYSIVQYRSLNIKLSDGLGNVFELGRGDLDNL